MNNTIQILRGDHFNICAPTGAGATVKLLEGQPLYNYTDNYLYIGPTGGNTLIKNVEPIAVKELHGPTGTGQSDTGGVEYYIREESNNLTIQDHQEIDFKIGQQKVVSVTGAGVGITGEIETENIKSSSGVHAFSYINNYLFNADDTGVYIGSNNGVEYKFAPSGPNTSNTMSASSGPTGKYYPVLDKATDSAGTQLKWIKEEDLMPAKVAVYSGSSTGTFTGYTIRQMSTSEVAVSIPNNSIIYVVD